MCGKKPERSFNPAREASFAWIFFLLNKLCSRAHLKLGEGHHFFSFFKKIENFILKESARPFPSGSLRLRIAVSYFEENKKKSSILKTFQMDEITGIDAQPCVCAKS